MLLLLDCYCYCSYNCCSNNLLLPWPGNSGSLQHVGFAAHICSLSCLFSFLFSVCFFLVISFYSLYVFFGMFSFYSLYVFLVIGTFFLVFCTILFPVFWMFISVFCMFFFQSSMSSFTFFHCKLPIYFVCFICMFCQLMDLPQAICGIMYTQ